MWLSVRSVPAFTTPKSTGHESFLSTWQRPRTWPKTTTSSSQNTEPEALPWLLGICKVIAPFRAVRGLPLFLISASAHPCPRAEGWERWAGVTGTPSSIQRGQPQGKEERKIYTMSTFVQYVKIYNPTESKADLLQEVSSNFNRTVRCLQSRQVFLEVSWISPCRNLWILWLLFM